MMEPKDFTTQFMGVDWAALFPYLLSALAPTIVGFLQQWSKVTVERLPWFAKSIFTAAIGALITIITNYVSGVDANVVAGAIVASIGSVNIALRKGTRTNLLAIREARVEEAVKKFAGCDEPKPTVTGTGV